MISLMGGEFKKDKMGKYFFEKRKQRIELEQTATGIKYFGIFQVLSQNNYLNENTVLVLDEPEVHLHPKWQLEMAKIIVELVEKGVKIVVNSHSPYMIDALKYYADKEKINNNFYLAEKNKDETSSISDVTMDISPIFEKLTEPLRELRKMKLGLK
jgi:predicted ATPase